MRGFTSRENKSLYGIRFIFGVPFVLIVVIGITIYIQTSRARSNMMRMKMDSFDTSVELNEKTRIYIDESFDRIDHFKNNDRARKICLEKLNKYTNRELIMSKDTQEEKENMVNVLMMNECMSISGETSVQEQESIQHEQESIPKPSTHTTVAQKMAQNMLGDENENDIEGGNLESGGDLMKLKSKTGEMGNKWNEKFASI